MLKVKGRTQFAPTQFFTFFVGVQGLRPKVTILTINTIYLKEKNNFYDLFGKAIKTNTAIAPKKIVEIIPTKVQTKIQINRQIWVH